MCDETQNLNETESETFFRYQIFSIPNPILFPIPIFFWYRYRYFFRYQNFTKPIPILFSIPKFFETDTDTFFDTNFFRNRYRYFFRYQFFSKPIPILFSIPKIFETDTDTIKKNGKVSKPRSFETEMSHSAIQMIKVKDSQGPADSSPYQVLSSLREMEQLEKLSCSVAPYSLFKLIGTNWCFVDQQ